MTKYCLFVSFPLHFFCNCVGRNQVAVGLSPIDFENKSSESALSIYPVAIANCKEKGQVKLTIIIIIIKQTNST